MESIVFTHTKLCNIEKVWNVPRMVARVGPTSHMLRMLVMQKMKSERVSAAINLNENERIEGLARNAMKIIKAPIRERIVRAVPE
jgi:hypothetical protein